VAVAIFALLAAIAVPDWGALLMTYYLNSGTLQIQSDLHWAKSRAVKENTSYRLAFTASGYTVERSAGSGWAPTGETRSLPAGIDIRSMTVSEISFTPRGTAAGGTLRLCNPRGQGRNIVVSGTGRVRVCRPAACNADC
jgi:Tfp pilus assembly protein FimT